MRFLLCVDDTDDLTKSTSTGTIAELISNEVQAMGGRIEKGITRHQLLLDDGIDYTSHNSSMCFAAEIDDSKLQDIKLAAERILMDNAAAEADPGVCICNLAQLNDPDGLIVFGLKAQNEILTKAQAYQVAAKVGGVWLHEFGGTGNGVIGALAGVGLRLCGNDGTFRGKMGKGVANVTMNAGELAVKLQADAIMTLTGERLPVDEVVTIEEHAKLAFRNHMVVAFVDKNAAGRYVVCSKRQMYDGESKLGAVVNECPNFVSDNDYEECYNDLDKNCFNCLYRRWSAKGFTCVK